MDTGAWAALVMPDDAHHREATAFFRALGRTRLRTSNYVLSESYTLLRTRSDHRTSVRFHRMVGDATKVGLLQVTWVSEADHAAAWDLFERFEQIPLSHCDCTTAVLARQHRIDVIFGFDADFRALGFDLRPAP